MKATFQKLVILAKAEKKQSITLGVLVVAAMGLWLRAAVKSGDDAPTGQQASDTAGAGSSAVTGPTLIEIKDFKTVALRAPGPMTRDVFVPRPEDFPPPAQPEPVDTAPAKSTTGNDDKTNELQELQPQTTAERVQEEAQQLRLRSTVVGAHSIAIIETSVAGEDARVVLKVGQSVEGFTLIRVLNRSAVLEKEGIEVTLSLPLY